MPKLHLTNGRTEEYNRILVKEQGLIIGASKHNKPQSAFPEHQVAEITDINDVYDNPYLMSEEYGDTRQAESSDPGEMVTEFKEERRVMVELQIE